MRRLVRWVLWSPRNAAVAAVGLLVVVVLATALVRLPGSVGAAGARQAPDTSTCAATATGFTDAFLDRSGSDGAWRRRLTPLVTRDAADQLARIPRDNLPTGRTVRVEAVEQPGSCDAIAVLDTGGRVDLEVAGEPGRWRVSGWGDGP